MSLQTLEACLWWHTSSDHAMYSNPPQIVPPTTDRAQDYRGHSIQASTLTNTFFFSVTCPVSSPIYVFRKGWLPLVLSALYKSKHHSLLSPPGLWLPSTSIQSCWKLKEGQCSLLKPSTQVAVSWKPLGSLYWTLLLLASCIRLLL